MEGKYSNREVTGECLIVLVSQGDIKVLLSDLVLEKDLQS